jgi:phosphate starvation-inducible protein PhoH and related proteins
MEVPAMSRKKSSKVELSPSSSTPVDKTVNRFNFSFFNEYQKQAWEEIEKNDITFLVGPAGCGKTQIASAYAANSILKKQQRKIILTRPCVATESLGFLPGTADEKIAPYLAPIIDCIEMCTGKDGVDRKRITEAIEFSPIAYLRGRTFSNSVTICDEFQNCTWEQIKLVLTRIGRRTKMIVTGDPYQSDIGNASGLMPMIARLRGIEGLAVVELPPASIVRHPIITKMLDRIEQP